MSTRRNAADFLQELSNLVLTEGISRLTIGEIADRLRCSRRRLYSLASTKEALFLLVSHRLFARVLEDGEQAAKDQANAVDAIWAYLHIGIAATRHLSVSYLNDLVSHGDGRLLFENFLHARAVGLSRLIEQGVSERVFAPHNARLVAEAILGASQRVRRESFLLEIGMDLEKASNELYMLFLKGLCPKSLPRSRSKKPRNDSTAKRSLRARPSARAESPAGELTPYLRYGPEFDES